MKLIREINGKYTHLSGSDVKLDLLRSLFNELGFNPSFFIDALESTSDDLGTNTLYLNRKGQRIILGDSLTSEKYEFELDISHLIEILKKWGELCQQGVDEIIMKRDGDRVTLEGKFTKAEN